MAFGPENLGIEPAEIRRRVDAALKAVNMYEYRDHAPHKLSGGQKQRVAIAGVIAMETMCIVLDEPTAMLDPRGRQEVMDTIRYLNREKGITVILITHYMDEAVQADRVVVMDGGSILTDGDPRTVFAQVELLKRHKLDVPQATELIYLLNAAGLDPKGRDVILAQISEYHRQRGNTILLVSHSMEDIGRVADRVLVMNNAHAEMYDETRAVFSRGELLEPMGLRLPQITSIMRRLRKMGLPVSETVLNVDEAVMELLPLLKKRKEEDKNHAI